MRNLLLSLLLTACVPRPNVREIETCEASDPSVDCCTTDDSCRGWFGDSFRYCETPGAETGRCVECRFDEDCDLESLCLEDLDHGSWCAPLTVLDP
ncbi:MAG: hypothetical protein EA397_07460 [Deltaproteobacteria bacterium]|nr:MAG: hypothetical protein EA397_07460 [Deltaproteobacteria bacterium]